MANPSSVLLPARENHDMQAEDTELEQFRTGVDCAALLEGWSPPWKLDRQESTRRALKYRRGAAEVLIVNHAGRGWWDPQSTAKGDIFDLVQHLDPRLNFGQVRRELRRFVGVVPSFPEALRGRANADPDVPITTRWMQRRRPHSTAAGSAPRRRHGRQSGRRAIRRTPRRVRLRGWHRLRAVGAPDRHRLERCPSGSEGIMNAHRAWVLLPSGRRLDLLNPDPWAWTDDDLATGLSRTYRWAGYSA
jgi:hypothetical protein